MSSGNPYGVGSFRRTVPGVGSGNVAPGTGSINAAAAAWNTQQAQRAAVVNAHNQAQRDEQARVRELQARCAEWLRTYRPPFDQDEQQWSKPNWLTGRSRVVSTTGLWRIESTELVHTETGEGDWDDLPLWSFTISEYGLIGPLQAPGTYVLTLSNLRAAIVRKVAITGVPWPYGD